MSKRYCYLTYSIDGNGNMVLLDAYSSEDEARIFCEAMNSTSDKWIFATELEIGMQKSFYDEHFEDAMRFFERNENRCFLFRKKHPKYKGFSKDTYCEWANAIFAKEHDGSLFYKYVKKELL